MKTKPAIPPIINFLKSIKKYLPLEKYKHHIKTLYYEELERVIKTSFTPEQIEYLIDLIMSDKKPCYNYNLKEGIIYKLLRTKKELYQTLTNYATQYDREYFKYLQKERNK